ncbi:MAG: S41 family peptidase [Bacillota bacterium]|nr:S41 family peptidase [Bacillota bacterium]
MTKKKKWIIITIVIVLITNTCTFMFSDVASVYLASHNVVIGNDTYKDILKFSKLFYIRNQLYKAYDGKIDDSKLIDGAIKGMTNALGDPYTVYMNKEDYTEYTTSFSGEYTGIGIQVEVKDNKIYVVSVFDGSPAKKSGMLMGDYIVKVNKEDVSGEELDKAITKIKGQKGTSVLITVDRKGKFIDMNITRDDIVTSPVKGKVIEGNIGYIILSRFNENSSADLKKELDSLKKSGIKGLILDLRGNPGGALDQCVDIASEFIEKGKTILTVKDKNNVKQVYKSKGGDYTSIPMTVLVDENSASASEVLTGALKDYKRATVVGTKTFGKGIVQEMLNTGEGSVLKVTYAKYYTPNGNYIHKIGLEPDIKVVYDQKLLEQVYDEKKDPQLNKAIEVIKDKLTK